MSTNPNNAGDPGGSEIRTRARAAADEVQRELVAQAVCHIIAEDGLEAATLRRTAAELGCTTGLISHYFKTKEELLIHALQHATRQLRESVESDLGPGPPSSIEDHLHAYCRALPLDPEQTQYWRVLAVFRSLALTNERLQAFFTEYGEARSSHYRPLLAAATGRKPDDVVVAKLDHALDAMLEGFALAATERPELYTREEVFRTVITALDAWINQASI